MERILCDWNELKNVQEVEIIKEYADLGRLITLAATCKQYFEKFHRSLDSIQTLIVQLQCSPMYVFFPSLWCSFYQIFWASHPAQMNPTYGNFRSE